jgi:radical SAM superfamily enzyme YgiQ (UPF0313 family)
VSEVIDEIRALPRRMVQFVDDNLVGDFAGAKELFRALIPLKICWMAQAGIEIAFDDELLDLAADSGCVGLLIGIESLNEDSLRQMGKSTRCHADKFSDAIARIHKRGIRICASFQFGYDHDTSAAFQKTLQFANEQKFMLAFFNPLAPYPGTPLYSEMQAQNRLKYDKWWLAHEYHYGDVVYDPKHFSANDLADGCWQNLQSFYMPSNILRRATLAANRRRMAESLVLNFLIRKDVRMKQGFPLGNTQPGLDA